MAVVELKVVHSESGEVVRTLDVSGKTESQVERVQMGLMRQMDLDNYHVEEVEA